MEFLLAGAFIAMFLYAAYRVLYLHLRGKRTIGTIVELRRDDSGDGVVFHPKVKFTTNTGTTIIAESTFGTPEAGTFYRVGEEVEIRYSASKPTFFAIVGYDVAAVLMLLLFAAGTCAILYWNYSQP
jgi:hypothetical protein